MSINLKKGEKVDLTKGTGILQYTIGLGNEHHKNPKYTVNFGILHNLLKLKN